MRWTLGFVIGLFVCCYGIVGFAGDPPKKKTEDAATAAKKDTKKANDAIGQKIPSAPKKEVAKEDDNWLPTMPSLSPKQKETKRQRLLRERTPLLGSDDTPGL